MSAEIWLRFDIRGGGKAVSIAALCAASIKEAVWAEEHGIDTHITPLCGGLHPDVAWEWCDAWMIEVGSFASEEALVAAAHLVVELQRYLAERIEERRTSPCEDILTDLVSAKKEDGSTLEVPQILSIVEQLMVAGNETTTAAIASGLLFLARHPELRQKLRAAPERITYFVEELLRIESPVQSMLRRTIEDTELASMRLPKSSIVMAHSVR